MRSTLDLAHAKLAAAVFFCRDIARAMNVALRIKL